MFWQPEGVGNMNTVKIIVRGDGPPVMPDLESQTLTRLI